MLRVSRRAEGWRLELSDGGVVDARVVLLASGSSAHHYLPHAWRVWWRHLPVERVGHVFDSRLRSIEVAGQSLAILGSSNAASWEAAIAAARRGARVTLFCRREAAIERQLPIDPYWFAVTVMRQMLQMPTAKRLRALKQRFVPKSTLPGSRELARSLGVRLRHAARFDLVWAATGVDPQVLGHFALAAIGYAAPTLASATRYLPLRLAEMLAQAGIDPGRRAVRRAPEPLEAVA